MVKIPLFHVIVALIIHIPDQAAAHDKVGREIIDVDPGRLRCGGHFLCLLQIRGSGSAAAHQVKHGIAFDVFLADPLRQLPLRNPLPVQRSLDFVDNLVIYHSCKVTVFV